MASSVEKQNDKKSTEREMESGNTSERDKKKLFFSCLLFDNNGIL